LRKNLSYDVWRAARLDPEGERADRSPQGEVGGDVGEAAADALRVARQQLGLDE